MVLAAGRTAEAACEVEAWRLVCAGIRTWPWGRRCIWTDTLFAW